MLNIEPYGKSHETPVFFKAITLVNEILENGNNLTRLQSAAMGLRIQVNSINISKY